MALADVHNDPQAHARALFRCTNATDTLPTRTPVDAPTPRWQRTTDHFAADRLPLFCRRAAGEPLPVLAYFDPITLAALPSIGRGTTLVLQLLGVSAAGMLIARYVRVVDGERSVVSSGSTHPEGPDLIGALLAAPNMTATTIRCTSDGPARPVSPLRWSPALCRLTQSDGDPIGGAAARSPMTAIVEVMCLDRPHIAVPVAVAWPAARAAELAAIGLGTVLTVTLRGRADDRLVARLNAIEARPLTLAAGDLRRVLFAAPYRDPTEPFELARCESMGVPVPRVMDDAERARFERGGEQVSSIATWVACRGSSGPAVHLSLAFRAGATRELLAIKRATTLIFRPVGAEGGAAIGAHAARGRYGCRAPRRQRSGWPDRSPPAHRVGSRRSRPPHRLRAARTRAGAGRHDGCSPRAPIDGRPGRPEPAPAPVP